MHIAFVPEELLGSLSAEIPYSPAFDGTICFETAGILVPEGDMVAQIRAALKKAQLIVEAGGYTMNDVVRVNIWMVNMKGNPALLNELYHEFLVEAGVRFNVEEGVVYPARQVIGVESLPHVDGPVRSRVQGLLYRLMSNHGSVRFTSSFELFREFFL